MNRRFPYGKLALSAAALLVVASLVGYYLSRGYGSRADASSSQSSEGERSEQAPVHVKVVKPLPGGIERVTTGPGTLKSFEYEELFAKVPGYLKNQKVDRGSEVKKGDIVAEIDAPELLKDVQYAAAKLEQAKSQVTQMKAHVAAAKSQLDAAKVTIVQKKAEVKRAGSNLKYRKKQYDRYQELVRYKSIDQRLVDEEFERLESAEAWKDAATAGVETAVAEVEAKKALVAQAQADLAAADANVDVADAALQKAQVFVEFTKLRSHYDGRVTARYFHNGDYIRSASQGEQTPLLVIQRTDLMRLVIQVPDADVPYCDPGDPVDFSISTVPHLKFPKLQVSRISYSQDPKSRTMRVEVDVPNEGHFLRDGMYGDATIHLQKGPSDAVRLPAAALKREEGKAFVFVVRNGVAHKVEVRVGINNGAEAGVFGLSPDDLVITAPGPHVRDGVAVNATVIKQ